MLAVTEVHEVCTGSCEITFGRLGSSSGAAEAEAVKFVWFFVDRRIPVDGELRSTEDGPHGNDGPIPEHERLPGLTINKR